MNVIKCAKIILSEKIFSSIIVTVANAKAMDELRLNAQCSLTTTTWRTPLFLLFFR